MNQRLGDTKKKSAALVRRSSRTSKKIWMNIIVYAPFPEKYHLSLRYPRTVVATIIQKGRVSRPIIGITFLESARANTVGIKKGVLVLDVKENTSAASSGLRPTTRTQASFC